jgi:spore germination cell wall hydrolase CwlJ-like protein
MNTKPRNSKRVFNNATYRNISYFSALLLILQYIIPANSEEKLPNSKINQKELECLSENIYFEGRNTDYAEMIRISSIVQNRIKFNKYKYNNCQIIHKYKQFSWTLQKSNNLQKIIKLTQNNPKELKAWQDSQAIAKLSLENHLYNNAGNSTAYHANYIKKPHSKFWKHMKLCIISPFHRYYSIKD